MKYNWKKIDKKLRSAKSLLANADHPRNTSTYKGYVETDAVRDLLLDVLPKMTETIKMIENDLTQNERPPEEVKK